MDINELMKLKSEIGFDTSGANSKDSETELIQLVSFKLDDVEYGVNIMVVHEILRYPQITRVPNTPNFIRGVINLRGNVIPVVDVRTRFGLSKTKISDLTRIIVIEMEDKCIGLLVDNVHQVVRMSPSNIDPPSSLLEGVSEDFISGIGRLKDRLIIIIRIGPILLDDVNEIAS
jgi:purine-binding chemotaxis protein CheW